MSLPETDLVQLAERGEAYEISSDANMICVVIRNFRLPEGYETTQSDLLLRLNPGYPDVPPDMWWFDPPVRLTAGRVIPATDCTEQYLGHSWQRWSRHFGPGQWRSGIDSLETFLALIRGELQRCALGPVR